MGTALHWAPRTLSLHCSTVLLSALPISPTFPLPHSFPHSLTHSLSLNHSLAQPLTHSLTHTFPHSPSQGPLGTAAPPSPRTHPTPQCKPFRPCDVATMLASKMEHTELKEAPVMAPRERGRERGGVCEDLHKRTCQISLCDIPEQCGQMTCNA